MPFIEKNGFEAWQELQSAIASGVFSNPDGFLLSESMSVAKQIVLAEMTRQSAVSNGIDLNILRQYRDFAEFAGARRPDPSREQWLWLYKNIGVRHPKLSVEEVCGIMAGRDALLPFLRTAPDLRFHRLLEEIEEPKYAAGSESFPYPHLEEALQGDNFAKLKILKFICRGITNEALFNRAVFLQKPKIVHGLLQSMPPDRQTPMLIRAMRYWDNPVELLRLCIENFGDNIASWHDDYGNTFFWYLYISDVPVEPELMAVLPPGILSSFHSPNRYGITPVDIWDWYRQGRIID